MIVEIAWVDETSFSSALPEDGRIFVKNV